MQISHGFFALFENLTYGVTYFVVQCDSGVFGDFHGGYAGEMESEGLDYLEKPHAFTQMMQKTLR